MIASLWVLEAQAKTTYIPTYDNRLIVIENGQLVSVKNQQPLLSKPSQDGLITCAIVQQVVSDDLVKSIKQAKRSAGWAMVAAGLNSFSAGMAEGQMNSGHANGYTVSNYVESRRATDASLAASADAKAQAEELKTLLVELVVKNNSDKEMLITDMDRGLVWFVLPHNEVALPMAKGEECHFRISSCAPLDENVKYINAIANSTLEKYTIGLETDLYWYVPMSDKAAKGLRFASDRKDGYIRVDKETMSMAFVSSEDFNAIKASKKDN